MNFLKKNSAKQGSCKMGKEKKPPGIRRRLAWAGGVVLLLIFLGVWVWNYLPIHYARFYLTRSALQTRGRLMDLWGKDKEGKGAEEDSLKLIADEVDWNGHSVLILPGGFGINWKEQRDEKHTFTQGSLDVYFLGAIRDGVHYWADRDNAVISIPGMKGPTIRTSQDTLKEVIGFSIVPEERDHLRDQLKTLKKDTVQMMNQSHMEFVSRDKSGVTIKASVPSGLFDAYLSKAGELLRAGPGKDMKEWGQMLEERKTQGEAQEIFFIIDKGLHITEIKVEGLADMSLLLESNEGLSVAGSIMLRERKLDMSAKVYFGNGQEGKRAFQIPELNLTYHNERFELGLKLSGGYEGGKISSDALEYRKLSETGGESSGDGLQKVKDEFLKRTGQLGLDFYK
ncbi:hypothetical protein H171_4327 [[Clostridium] celerecrescens 18A]|uniref:Uncharacterized protein n=2 Tax=Lacrimispora celerecrescens TaxID=29354 RepID=A0A2M8ZB84_9FIRM|nr:hypothetical protein H171_4327 [[Clostridium] celerecrescens 18A]